MKPAVTEVSALTGHQFQNAALLEHALTLGFGNYKIGYERLEFLGDRVLGLIIAQMLYESFPNEKEGGLAKRHAFLVSGETLAQLAEKWSLAQYLIVPKGEEKAANRHSVNVLSDVVEAIIAALYLDGGLSAAETFIRKHWQKMLEDVRETPLNPKTALQEWTQKRGLPLPVYEILKKEGAQHEPVFTVQVAVQGLTPVCATEKSKHGAEKSAAELLLKEINANG